jgi:hypothetical protein
VILNADDAAFLGDELSASVSAVLEAGGHVFATSPEVSARLSGVTWLPLWYERAATAAEPLFSERSPVTLGAGVASVPPALEPFRVRWLDPHAPEWESAVRSCDIVLDCQRAGHGAAAISGMAAGRLVIGVGKAWTDVPEPPRPPMLFVPDSDLHRVLVEINSDPVAFAAIAAGGPEFVKRWHDGDETFRRLTRLVE